MEDKGVILVRFMQTHFSIISVYSNKGCFLPKVQERGHLYKGNMLCFQAEAKKDLKTSVSPSFNCLQLKYLCQSSIFGAYIFLSSSCLRGNQSSFANKNIKPQNQYL